MSQCTRRELGGKRCELDEAHDGKHSVAWSDGGALQWDDKSQSDLLNRYGGTRGT